MGRTAEPRRASRMRRVNRASDNARCDLAEPISNALQRHDTLKRFCDIYIKLTRSRVAVRINESKFGGLDLEPTHLPAILSSMPLT